MTAVVPRENPVYPFVRPPGLGEGRPRRYPLVVAGAGPIGLCAGLDAACRGMPCVVLDDNDTVSVGSRAVCWAKRVLEIFDRYGVGDRVVGKGVTWNLGKVFLGERKVYEFNLLPEADHERPAFVNLQQYWIEQFLVERVDEVDGVDLRWRNQVVGVDQDSDRVRLAVETPEGPYRIDCDWLIVCDGANSAIRSMLGLESRGEVFQDRFLIVDVVMKAEFPTERWFWFNPPFHPGRNTLLHRQADNVWRIDFQLGPDADPDEARKPDNVVPRLRQMLGEDVEFDLEWVSVYTFQCRRMERFRHGRVMFAGDAAHQVSPFGARGANSGIQDIDNLMWKLALVTSGSAPASLLDSYDAERVPAAEENILHSTRSTEFITPGSDVSRAFRDAVLMLAEHHPFARALVNSGRLSVPSVYRGSTLNSADEETFAGAMSPGSPCTDAPVRIDGSDTWFLRVIGRGFALLLFAGGDDSGHGEAEELARQAQGDPPLDILVAGAGPAPRSLPGRRLVDSKGLLRRRYDGQPGTCYLLRPDQHVAGRWRQYDPDKVSAALDLAVGRMS